MKNKQHNRRKVQRRRALAAAANRKPKVTTISRLRRVRDVMRAEFMATGITRIMGEDEMLDMLDGVMAIMGAHIQSECDTDLPSNHDDLDAAISSLFLGSQS